MGGARRRAWAWPSTSCSRTRPARRASSSGGAAATSSAPAVDEDARIVEIPRPAGVVLALTPSTNPIATVYFKVLLSLMTRNAVVVSPHPLAREVSADAVAPPRPRRGGGRRAGRLHPGRRGADDPADRGAHGRPDDRRDRRHRRHRGRSRRVPLGESGLGRRAGQRAGAGRLHRRPGRGGEAADGLEELRQLHPLHQRVVRHRGGARRRRLPEGARPARRPRARSRGRRRRTRGALPRRAAAGRAGRQGRAHSCPRGRRPGARRHAGAGGAVLAGRSRGAAGAREALPAARARPRARRPPRNRRRARHAADRRRRPLGGDPLARPADDHGLRRSRPGAARGRQRRREHRLRRHRHQPGPDDDGRHRVLRALVSGREPRAQAPDQPDAGRVRVRPGRAVRRVRRPRSRGTRPSTREPVAAPAMPPDVERAREEIRRVVLEELRELVHR